MSSCLVFFSSVFTFLLFFFCYSSAEQHISLPHVNSWLHIHSPRQGCRKRLPVGSDDSWRCSGSDTLLWIPPYFSRPSGQHVVEVRTASSVPCIPLSSPSFFPLSAAWWRRNALKHFQNRNRNANQQLLLALISSLHLYLLLLFRLAEANICRWNIMTGCYRIIYILCKLFFAFKHNRPQNKLYTSGK